MLKLYYETDAIKVSYDANLQLGIGEWKGFVSSKDIRSTALQTLDFISEHSITRWLSDRRKMKAIRQQDQQWSVEEFIPKLMQSSLRRMASVLSEDMFNRMAVEQMLKRSGGLGDIALRDFEQIEDALKWLKQPLKEEAAT